MRYIIPIALALSPVLIIQSTLDGFVHHKKEASYAGRGHVNPPTVRDMRLAFEAKQTKCLATMIYGEARGEVRAGKVAVAYSAKNRAGKKTVCQVVLAPYQYSIFNNNPALRAAALSLHVDPKKRNKIEEAAWKESLEVAAAVYKKKIPDPTNGATHYLAPALMKKLGYKFPKWSRVYKKVAIIDAHHFYKK